MLQFFFCEDEMNTGSKQPLQSVNFASAVDTVSCRYYYCRLASYKSMKALSTFYLTREE